ncbi:MAG: peptidoglycan editing factor PgeF [Gammaproteobacteria bacterium]|jgi:YfiH family protein
MPSPELDVAHLGWLMPEWPAPAWVRACSTTRSGGVSEGCFASLNLAEHVGDDPSHVAANRRRLLEALHLPAMPLWLSQVHGTSVVDVATAKPACEADASLAARSDIVCAVLTADCLPVLLCDSGGTRVAAVHAGWRGLLAGVIEKAVLALHGPGSQLLAWLGPAIGPEAFEVGDEVRDAFVAADAQASLAFEPTATGRWLADIYMLARQRLARVNVTAVSGGHWCTVNDEARFYSYRRDGVTGRMASLIWLDTSRR